MVVTVATHYKTNSLGEHVGDEFPEILFRGYDEDDAFAEAMKILEYACCSEFGNPKSFAKDNVISWYPTEAVILEGDADPTEIAQELWNDIDLTIEFNGKQYVTFLNRCDSCVGGGEIYSNDLRKLETMPSSAAEMKKMLDRL
jgi:hypothetical protein